MEFNTISNLKHFDYGVTSRDNSEKNAFMYSDSILWIGSVLNCWETYYKIKKQYVIWLIDLDQSTCVKTWCADWIESIKLGHQILTHVDWSRSINQITYCCLIL